MSAVMSNLGCCIDVGTEKDNGWFWTPWSYAYIALTDAHDGLQ